jgi:hypothetical protein
MAEKRAKDRVILKLVELHGLVYSEEEADEFKDARPGAVGAFAAPGPREVEPAEADEVAASTGPSGAVQAELKGRIDRARSINAVTDLMLAPDTQEALASLPAGLRDEIRDHAKARLVALGWPSKKAA